MPSTLHVPAAATERGQQLPHPIKTRLAPTPALSSPGLFSSPTESHDAYDRCETPVSPTELVARPRIHTGSSSPAPWAVDALLLRRKGLADGGDTDEDATDDDFADDDDDAPMLTDAETSSEWALEPSVEPEPALIARHHPPPAIADDAASLEAAELLLFLAGAPKLQPVASTSQLAPVAMDVDPLPVPTSSSPVELPPMPSTPPKAVVQALPNDEIAPGEMSDLTPLRPSPAPAVRRRKPGPRERAQQKKGTAKPTKLKDDDDNDAEMPPSPAAKRTLKRKRAAVPSPPAKPSPKKRAPVVIDNADAATVSEIEGFLVETLALSRSSSMPATQLLAAVLQEQPHLRAARSESDWLPVFRDILAAFDVFGRARRSGKAADGKPPEDQWFYQPKRDPQPERAQLLSELMRNKRTATMNGDVQYYYKPIPRKVTVRW